MTRPWSSSQAKPALPLSSSCRDRRENKNGRRRTRQSRVVPPLPPETTAAAQRTSESTSWAVQGPLSAVRAFLDDRLAADPRFLTKMGIETLIDSACTLAAELSARREAVLGSQWAFVLDDLVTTVLLDVAIVSIIAPSAAKSSVASTHLQTGSVEAQQGHVWLWIAELAASLPNSAFEASPAAGARYSAVQRALAALATAAQYGILGLVCGGLGQAVTNALALYAAVQVDAPPPPMPSVLSVAVLWARYMASNASVRYQLVSALEGMAERSTLGSSPAALVAVSTATRLTNNVYGAVLFVDMMRANNLSP